MSVWLILSEKVKKENLASFESVMFAVELPENSAVVCIVTLFFEHAQQIHISHFTYLLRYYMIIDHCWSCWQCLASYIKLCNYVMLYSNEPTKVSHLQKLVNQCALAIEKWFNNSFSEGMNARKTFLV